MMIEKERGYGWGCVRADDDGRWPVLRMAALCYCRLGWALAKTLIKTVVWLDLGFMLLRLTTTAIEMSPDVAKGVKKAGRKM